jgi:hypothetical protein
MTKAELDTIREIESAALSARKIPSATVHAWLDHASLEILGAVNVHIMQNTRLVEPPLSMEKICSTVQEYYKQCLIQNLQTSQYAPNRSIAGLELVGWFQSLWRDPAVPREYLIRLKAMLQDLCLEGKVPQDQMAGSVLEHLFETPQIAEFFADWSSDSQLKKAFELAMDWAQDHRPPNLPQA